MKLKLDDKGAVVVQDGKPVYVHDDGKEVAFDAPATVATIGRLNAEAKGHRERAEGAEAKLKLFEGLDDPEAARKALSVVKNLDDKKLVDAGEVDRVKSEAIKAVEEKYKPYVSKAEKAERQLLDLMIGGSFKGSKFATEKFAAKGQAGADIAQALFGGRFKVESDRVVGYHATGDKIFSRARPGELADFDEALEMIVEAYPHKDQILAGSGSSGSGAGGASGGGGGGKKSLTRAQFAQLTPAEQMAHSKAVGEGKAELVD